MCDFSCSPQNSWISLCKGYNLRITGPETSKSPLSVNVILAQSTLISSRPPLSCHLYPQNQTPVCLWPQSHPYHHNPRRVPPRAPVNESAQPGEQEGHCENSHSSRCRPKDSGVIPQGPAGGCQPRAWENPEGQRDQTKATAGGFGKGTSRGDH